MKKAYYCEKLEKTLHFLPNEVKYCCSYAEGPGLKISDFSKFDKDDIEESRKRYISFLKNGQMPRECKGCLEFKEQTFKEQIKSLFKKPETKKIKHIIIDHFKQCDCDCIYCSQKKLFPSRNQRYEILPIIKELYSKNMIDLKDLKVEFQGGNISCLDEFEPLMREFKQNGCDDFVILMNGIKYIPLLEEIGSNLKSHICISLDAGTKETFNKIKNVDAWDTVIANIKQLREKSQAHISLKYIIIKDVNDNKEELLKFLEVVKEIGNIDPVYLEIDYNDILLNNTVQFTIPSHYYELFEIAENYSKENGLNYRVFPHIQTILDKGSN